MEYREPRLGRSGLSEGFERFQGLSAEELNRLQKKTEMIFLVNDVLDIGYVAAGFWLRRNAASQADQEAMYRGYGDSMIMQGSVL